MEGDEPRPESVTHEARKDNLVFRASTPELADKTMQGHLQMTEVWAHELQKEAIPMSDKLATCIEDIKATIGQYLEKQGIHNYQWPENMHLFVFKNGYASAAGGSHKEHSVLFAEQFPSKTKLKLPEDKADEMEEVFLALAFAEELSHSVGGKIFDVVLEDEKDRNIFKWGKKKKSRKIARPILTKSGLTYPDKVGDQEDDLALEEGLVEEILIPAQATIWKHYRDEVALPIFDAFNRKIAYPDSIELTTFLKKDVPNFVPLAQKARVENDDQPLREALEERYGTGSFDKIVGATEKTARKVLEELQAPSKMNHS